MDKLELKKGYTPAELSAFMQQVFREKKKAERTPDGGWRVVEKYASPEIVPPEVSTVDSPQEQPEKKGMWRRLQSFFQTKTE